MLFAKFIYLSLITLSVLITKNDQIFAAICERTQIMGHDEVESHTFEMGAKKVYYENKIILDTGCVGSDDAVDKTLSYQGDSTQITVKVEPHCDGGTGTDWFFLIGCPDVCETNANAVLITENNKQVYNGDTLYINAIPEMPKLTARYCKIGIDPKTVKWSLKITPFKNKDSKICKMTKFSGTGDKWDIKDAVKANIQGGDAELSWKEKTNKGTLKFKILGTQPDPFTVASLVRSSSKLWYPKYVAMHESEYRQFDEDGAPLKSFDNGFGIFQLTKPAPKCLHLWNWKENVKEGIERLEGFSEAAYAWMEKQRDQAERENKGENIPVPDHRNSKCFFRENSTMVIEDAVAMKQFNGASGGNYCSWQNKVGKTPGAWKFNQMNTFDEPFDYVNRVCDRI